MAPKQRKFVEVQDIERIKVATFTISKLLDDQVIIQIGEELKELAEKASQEKSSVVLDFSRVEYVSAAALGKLIVLRKALEDDKRNKRLVLTNIDSDIQDAFVITGFNRLFNFAASEQEAMQILSASALAQGGGKLGYSR